MPGLGAKSYITLTEETTWGTFKASPTTRDVHARIVRDEVEDNENTFQSPALGSRAVNAMYQGEREVGGTVEFEVGYEGVLLYLLKHALGGYDFTVNSPVTGANLHTFSTKEDLPIGFSMEDCIGGVPGVAPAVKVIRYPGVKVSALEISLEQGQIMKCIADLIAKDEDTNGLLGHDPLAAFSPPTLRPIKFFYHTTLSIAGSAVTVCRNWKLRVDNDLQRRFNLKQLTDEPIPGAKRAVIFDAEMEFNDLAHYNKYKSATEGSFSLLVQSGTDQVVTGVQPYSLSITGNTSRITGSRPKVTDSGIVLMPITCQLIAPSGSELTVTIINAQGTIGSEIL